MYFVFKAVLSNTSPNSCCLLILAPQVLDFSLEKIMEKEQRDCTVNHDVPVLKCRICYELTVNLTQKLGAKRLACQLQDEKSTELRKDVTSAAQKSLGAVVKRPEINI